MKINVREANKETIFFVYCDVYLKKTFHTSFFENIEYIDYKKVFEKYKPILVENHWFSFLKDLAFEKRKYEQNEDVQSFNKNFANTNLDFWKKEYVNFNYDEKFNVNILDKTLQQYFGYTVEDTIDVILVPKNSCDNLRMHSGVTNIREKNLIFIFVPEYKDDVPYKRLSLEVLLHEVIHLYIYRSEWYKKICAVANERFSHLANKNKIEGISNELLARVFLAPNIFGLVRGTFNRNVLAEHPLREPMNITANNILQGILNKKIDTINDDFVTIFISHLENLLSKK